MITFGALFTMLTTVLIGREAFVNFYHEGAKTLTGNIYYLTEFRQYIGELYTQALLGYVGIGDENGYPIETIGAEEASAKARSEFKNLAQKGGTDLTYYINYKNNNIFLNIDFPLFSAYDNHLLLSDDVTLCSYWNGPANTNVFFDRSSEGIISLTNQYYSEQYSPNATAAEKARVLIAINNTGEYQSEYLNTLSETAVGYAKILWTFFISCILFVIFAPCCLLTQKAGKQAFDNYTTFSSKIWFEIKLVILLATLIVCFQLHLWHFNGALFRRIFASNYIYLYFPVGILLYLFFVDLSHNTATIVKTTLIYKVVQYINQFLRSVSWKRKVMLLQLCTMLASALLITTGILLLTSNGIRHRVLKLGITTLIAGILLFIVSLCLKKFIRDIILLIDKLDAVHAGNVSEPLLLSKHSYIKQAAEQLNSVEDGIEAAIAESERSSKMRVELITNVSHDLKTPLTSIINYADLLCEENLPAPANEYAAAMRSKAYRLKNMVQDVFEISKATSGNLPVELIQLDLVKLIRQTLADMDEQIQESNLTFKLKCTEESLMIEADGNKLYRVFQNLFLNALQYSLENSRVHIILSKDDSFAYTQVKNISKQELDFDPSEIVERFVRADSSRTTEGSGLGLSISQSFTEACGGTFRVETDADMFTARITFPLS